jgi:hypothetical protein
MPGYFPDLKLLASPAANWNSLPVSLAIGYEHLVGTPKNLAQVIILPVNFDAVTTILSHGVVNNSVLAS